MKRLFLVFVLLLGCCGSVLAEEPMHLARMNPAVIGGGTPASASPPTYFGSATRSGCEDGSCGVTDASTPITVTPPSSMLAGDLVVVIMQLRYNSTPAFTVSTDGGQSWTSETQYIKAGSQYCRMFWCTFDGTWDASPAFDVDISDGAGITVVMHVFRPGSTPHTWQKDVDQATTSYSTPSTPYDITISGITTGHSNSVALFTFTDADDSTWTLQTAGFTSTNFNAGVYYIANTGGADQSIQTVYKIMENAGGTGDVTSRQGTVYAEGTTHSISFY